MTLIVWERFSYRVNWVRVKHLECYQRFYYNSWYFGHSSVDRSGYIIIAKYAVGGIREKWQYINDIVLLTFFRYFIEF